MVDVVGCGAPGGRGPGSCRAPGGNWWQKAAPAAATRQTRTAFKPVSAAAASRRSGDSRCGSAARAVETDDGASELEQMVVETLNREREAAGVPPLRRDERLSRGARRHASAMLRERRLFQLAPGESDLMRERIAPTGYRCRVTNQSRLVLPTRLAGWSSFYRGESRERPGPAGW